MVELLSILGDVFTREPPVMSRQQIPAAPSQSPRPPPLPPHPEEQPRETPQASRSSPVQPAPPPPPPKQRLGADANGIPNQGPLSRYDAPPPLPDGVGSNSAPSLPYSRAAAAPSQPSRFISQRNNTLRQSMASQHFQQ